MLTIQTLQSFEQLKLLTDPRRLLILRILMSGQASLTMLGKQLGEHPAWVRHHLKLLEDAGLVELTEIHSQTGSVEKFYRARAGIFLFHQAILPEFPPKSTIVFSGSHDLAVELLAERLSPHLHLVMLPVGSLDGLVALRQKLSQVSGCHLLDPSGEFNLPYVHHFFPDRSMQVITLAQREQGLMTVNGNPKGIRSLGDLIRPDVSIINRNPGSGTRLWFDQQIAALGIPASSIKGYDTTVRTHTECARLVQSGAADAAIGLCAAAYLYELSFIPLFNERYDLVFQKEMCTSLTPLLDTLQSGFFRNSVTALTGYETIHSGEQIL